MFVEFVLILDCVYMNSSLCTNFSYFIKKHNYINEYQIRAEIVNLIEDYKYSSAIDWAGGKGLLE